ncbi:MAG: PilZ domain-containing protein [Planctomycetota bacterium]
MTNDEPNEGLAQDERRRQTRRPVEDTVLIRTLPTTAEGHVENLSDDGLFVVLEGAVHMEVEFAAEAGVPPRRARLVRCQSLPGGRSGWGLQFDPDTDGARDEES